MREVVRHRTKNFVLQRPRPCVFANFRVAEIISVRIIAPARLKKALRQTFYRLAVGEFDEVAVGVAEGGEVADGAAEIRGWVNEDA